MRVMQFPRVFALAGGVALLASACSGMSNDSFGQELQADAAAIRADKEQIDLDMQAGSATRLMRDRHKLYLDTEKQEHDRGTEDDEFAEGEWQ